MIDANKKFWKYFFLIILLSYNIFSNDFRTKKSQTISSKSQLKIENFIEETSQLETENFIEEIKIFLKKYTYQAKSNYKPFHNSKLNNTSDINDLICSQCMKLFTPIQEFMLKKSLTFIKKIFIYICSLFRQYEECQMYGNAFGDLGSISLIKHYFNPEYMCTFSYMCENINFIESNADDYARKILVDKPKLKPSQYMEINTQAKIWKILHVTDLHVDLKYDEGSNGECSLHICCRKENEEFLKYNLQNKTNLAGKYGYIGKCDIPLITLENFADKVFTEIKPDFIIWTGDNTDHYYYDNHSFKVTELFTQMIKKKYNYTLPVYPSIGNHEKFPTNVYDTSNYSQEIEFLTSFGNLFKDWIGEEAYENFLKFGYYTKIHPGTNLRIISLNCFLCYNINLYLIRDPTDPLSQLKWIENTLREAEKNKEVVYLISHINPGEANMLSECAKRMKVLIDRFAHIIKGQFYGHTHYDELKIHTNYFDKTIVSSISYTAPSLTTFPYRFPSFRIYEIDSDSKLVRDYIQYQMNVTKANENDEPKWEIFYKASDLFNVTFLNETEKIHEMTQKINEDNQIYKNLLKVFFTNGPLYEKYLVNERMPRYLNCRLNSDVYRDYLLCTDYSSWESSDMFGLVFEFLSGPWYERTPK